MKLLVIYNPHAGAGNGKKILPKIEQYLASKGLKCDFLMTEYSGHAVKLAQEAPLDGYDGIIASGGDGTMYEVLNGYYLNKSNSKPPIGIIPNGTGNAFVKDLHLQFTDWKIAIDIIKDAKTKKIDVARYKQRGETKYFINILGTCMVADMAKTAVKCKFLGNSAYTLAVLLELINLRPTKTTVTLDGKVLERDCTLIEVSNSRFTGTTFLMAPSAVLDDGLLDVTILNKVTRLRLLKILQTIFTGDHIHEPEVETFTAKNIKIETEIPYTLVPDGEILGTTPVEIECLKQDVEIFWRD